MATAEELIVAISAEGAEDAQEEIEGVEEGVSETTDSIEDSSEQLEEFSTRFRGALAAATAALTVAAGGILSQVPILQEAFAGLNAVFEAVGLQVDQLLRDLGAGGLVDTLFNLAGAIGSAEGPVGDLVGALGGLVSIAAGSAGAIFALNQLGVISISLSGVLSTLAGSILPGVAAGLTAVASALGLPVAGVLALGAAVTGLVAIFATDFMGIRTTVLNVLGTVADAFTDAAGRIAGFGADVISGAVSGLQNNIPDLETAAETVKDALLLSFVGLPLAALRLGREFVSKVADGIGQLLPDIELSVGRIVDGMVNAFNDLVDMAVGWGKGIIEGIIQGLINKKDELFETVGDIAGGIRARLPGSPADTGPLSDLDEAGPGLVNTLSDGIEAELPTATATADDLAGAIAQGDTNAAIPRGGAGQTVLSIDGRELDESTGRFGEDKLTRRGVID